MSDRTDDDDDDLLIHTAEFMEKNGVSVENFEAIGSLAPVLETTGETLDADTLRKAASAVHSEEITGVLGKKVPPNAGYAAMLKHISEKMEKSGKKLNSRQKAIVKLSKRVNEPIERLQKSRDGITGFSSSAIITSVLIGAVSLVRSLAGNRAVSSLAKSSFNSVLKEAKKISGKKGFSENMIMVKAVVSAIPGVSVSAFEAGIAGMERSLEREYNQAVKAKEAARQKHIAKGNIIRAAWLKGKPNKPTLGSLLSRLSAAEVAQLSTADEAGRNAILAKATESSFGIGLRRMGITLTVVGGVLGGLALASGIAAVGAIVASVSVLGSVVSFVASVPTLSTILVVPALMLVAPKLMGIFLKSRI